MTDRHSRREITHRPARVRGATDRPDPRKALPLRRGGLRHSRSANERTNSLTSLPSSKTSSGAQRRRRRRTMATRLSSRRHRSVHGRRTHCAREGRRRPLAIPVLLGEDHIRGARPVSARRRTRDPGARHLREVLARIELHGAEDIVRLLPPLPRRHSAPASWRPCLDAACCSRSGPLTTCGRSTSSKRPASAAAPRCTGGSLPRRDRHRLLSGDRSLKRAPRSGGAPRVRRGFRVHRGLTSRPHRLGA